MKRILVTGGNGQLGCEMRRVAATTLCDAEFFFTDIRELDITSECDVMRYVEQHAIDVIVNCAAYTDADRAESDEACATLLNVAAVGYLAQAAAARGALLIHISSDYVFGGVANTPLTEESMPCPLGVYGRTKLQGERLLAESGCRYIILRTSWLYSVHRRNFVKTMRRLLRERDVVSVVFDQVGTPTFAGDLVDAIAQIIRAEPTEAQNGVYHFSNWGVCSWYDFAEAIRILSGYSSRVVPCHSSEYPSHVVRPSYSVLDKGKICRVFGLQIPHWYTSLVRCIGDLQAVESVSPSANQFE